MKDLVVSKFGQDKWDLILAELKVEDEASVLIARKQYDDSITVAAVEAVCKVLGAPWDTALELYGAHFVAYVYEGGFGRMLRNMGDNLQDFLENINHMHQYLERNFRESSFPVWGVEPESESSFILSYSSARGLALKGIIKGLLQEAARRLFRQKVELEELDETRAGYLLTMRVTTSALPEAEEPAARETVDDPQQRKNAALWHECFKSLGRSGTTGDLEAIAKRCSSLAAGTSLGRSGTTGDLATMAKKRFSSFTSGASDREEQNEKNGEEEEEAAGMDDAATAEGHSSPGSIGVEDSEDAADEEAVQEGGEEEKDAPAAQERAMEAGGSCPAEMEHHRLYLDTLAKLVRADPKGAGDALMRAVPAAAVCAEWGDAASLDNARVFWETYAGDTRYFSYSKCAPRASRFVSHSWRPPSDWAQVMGERTNYAEIKATELTIVAQDLIAAGRCSEVQPQHGVQGAAPWKDVLFWVDKCCIPQGHPIIQEYFARLEDFIQRSDGMVVLLSWQYFSRLWCIYEWASFLVYHSPSNVQLCVDYFLKPATQQLYLRSIADFSVADAHCDVESDREILRAKIAQHFVSEAAFETYVKATAVALLARTAARRAGRNKLEYQQEFAPWVDLAGELGFAGLAAALRTAKPIAWRADAMRDSLDCLGQAARAWLETYDATITEWFEQRVMPELELLRSRCVRRELLGASAELASGSEACSSCQSTEAESGASTDCISGDQGKEDAPQCPACCRGMEWSSSAPGAYRWGWDCAHKETCGASSDTHGPWRWWCERCSVDLDQVCAFRGPPSQPPPPPLASSVKSTPRPLLHRLLRPRACSGKGGVAQPQPVSGGAPR